MIRYLVAQTITDELPFGLAIEFHPSPPHSYRYMARKAPQDTIDWWKNNVIPTLQEFTTKYDLILAEMNQDFQFNQQQALLFNEIKIALQVTNLRVKHKIETIQFLLEKRQQKLDKNLPPFTFESISIRLKRFVYRGSNW
jgi:Fe-S cluster biosynthesis and repair protein YggX